MATITNKTSGLEIVFGGATTYIKHGNVKLLKRGTNLNIYDDSEESSSTGQAYMSIPFANVTSPATASINALYTEVLSYVDVSISGTISNFVNVSSKSDLPTAVGGVITLLDDYTYFFLKDLDLVGDRLLGGENTVILAPSSENVKITSTGLGIGVALLTSFYTLPIRHISFIDVDTAFYFDGVATRLALDWTGVNLENVPSIGTMANISNFIFSKGALINSQNWIFTGTQGTISFDNSLLQGDGSVGNIIKVDALAVIDRRFRIVYSSVVAFGSTIGIDFNASATVPTEGYILDTVVFSGGGTYTTGVTNTSNKSRWVNSRGVTNTAVNGQLYMQNNATATVVADTTTFVKVAGTTLASVDNEKYLMPINNRLENDAVIERKFLIQCSLSFNTANNKVCEFGFYDSKLGSVRVPSRTKSTSNGNGRAENLFMSCVVSHSDGNYLEIHCRNTTSVNNITVTGMNFVITEIN